MLHIIMVIFEFSHQAKDDVVAGMRQNQLVHWYHWQIQVRRGGFHKKALQTLRFLPIPLKTPPHTPNSACLAILSQITALDTLLISPSTKSNQVIALVTKV